MSEDSDMDMDDIPPERSLALNTNVPPIAPMGARSTSASQRNTPVSGVPTSISAVARRPDEGSRDLVTAQDYHSELERHDQSLFAIMLLQQSRIELVSKRSRIQHDIDRFGPTINDETRGSVSNSVRQIDESLARLDETLEKEKRRRGQATHALANFMAKMTPQKTPEGNRDASPVKATLPSSTGESAATADPSNIRGKLVRIQDDLRQLAKVVDETREDAKSEYRNSHDTRDRIKSMSRDIKRMDEDIGDIFDDVKKLRKAEDVSRKFETLSQDMKDLAARMERRGSSSVAAPPTQFSADQIKFIHEEVGKAPGMKTLEAKVKALSMAPRQNDEEVEKIQRQSTEGLEQVRKALDERTMEMTSKIDGVLDRLAALDSRAQVQNDSTTQAIQALKDQQISPWSPESERRKNDAADASQNLPMKRLEMVEHRMNNCFVVMQGLNARFENTTSASQARRFLELLREQIPELQTIQSAVADLQNFVGELKRESNAHRQTIQSYSGAFERIDALDASIKETKDRLGGLGTHGAGISSEDATRLETLVKENQAKADELQNGRKQLATRLQETQTRLGELETHYTQHYGKMEAKLDAITHHLSWDNVHKLMTLLPGADADKTKVTTTGAPAASAPSRRPSEGQKSTRLSSSDDSDDDEDGFMKPPRTAQQRAQARHNGSANSAVGLGTSIFSLNPKKARKRRRLDGGDGTDDDDD